MKQPIGLFALGLVLSLARPAPAQGPGKGEIPAPGRLMEGPPSGTVLLASLQPPGLDLARLNHFFDAVPMRARLGGPNPARIQAPVPPKEGRAAEGLGPGAAAPHKPMDRGLRVLPVPAPPAYRRTFRLLLAHPEKTDRYDELILEYAQAYSLDARLMKAIIAAESEFSFRALSPRGARGLMQVMPRTASEMGVPGARLWEPRFNIQAGASYLARLFKAAWRKYKLRGVRFHDAPLWLKERIIAAYNAGPRFLFHDRWYRQTRSYVRKVMLFYRSRVTDFRRSPGSLLAWGGIPLVTASGTLY